MEGTRPEGRDRSYEDAMGRPASVAVSAPVMNRDIGLAERNAVKKRNAQTIWLREAQEIPFETRCTW